MQNVGDFLHRKEDPMAFCVKDHPRPTVECWGKQGDGWVSVSLERGKLTTLF